MVTAGGDIRFSQLSKRSAFYLRTLVMHFWYAMVLMDALRQAIEISRFETVFEMFCDAICKVPAERGAMKPGSTAPQ